MASEGTLNSVTTSWPNGGSNGGYFEFHWWTLEVNKAENKTKIAWTFSIKGYNGGYVATRWLKINSSWYGIGHPRDGYYPPATGDTTYYYDGATILSDTNGMWITHNSDGTGSFEVEIWGCISQSYDNTWYEGSGHYNTYLNTTTVTLDPIPRTVTAVSNGSGTAGVSEYPWDSSAADFKPSVSVIPNSTVYFQATPTVGHHLVNWTENSTVISTAPTFSVTVTEDRTLTANFAVNSHTVTLSKDSVVSSVTGGGVYNYNSPVTVTAVLPSDTAEHKYTFDGWYENNVSTSTQPVYSFTMPNRSVTLTAKGIEELRSYTVTVIADKGLYVRGTVGSNSVTVPRVTPIIKPAVNSATYSVNYNVNVDLEATESELADYDFDHWEIDGVPVESSESSESYNLVTNVTGDNVFKAVSVINKWLVQLDGDLPDGVKCYTDSAMTQEWSGISKYDKSTGDKNTFKLYTKIEGTHNRQFSRPTVLEEVAYLDEYNWKGWIINGVQTPLALDDTLTFSVDKDYTIKPWIEPVDFKLISVTTKYNENIDNTKGTVEISYTSLKSNFTYKNNKYLYIPDVDETASKTNKIKFTAKPAVNYCLEKFTYYGVREDVNTDREESTGNRGIDNLGASTIVIYDNPMYLSISNAEQVTAYFELWNYEGATWKHCYVFVKTGDDNKPNKGWKVVKDYKYWNGTEWKDHVD